MSAWPLVWFQIYKPAKPGGGGGNPGPGCCIIGTAWPSAAYEEVIESITDCAFSWPISVTLLDLSTLSLFLTRTLIIFYHVPQMVSAAVVGFPY